MDRASSWTGTASLVRRRVRLGFRPLPEALRSGDGRVGFGIVSGEEGGERMFANVPRVRPSQAYPPLYLSPQDRAEHLPEPRERVQRMKVMR